MLICEKTASLRCNDGSVTSKYAYIVIVIFFFTLMRIFWCDSFWTIPGTKNHVVPRRQQQGQELQIESEDCTTKRVSYKL